MSDTGLTYQAPLPLRCTLERADEAMLASARTANLMLLRALAVLEAAHDKESDADQLTLKAMERLEAKLDITIALLSRLLMQHAQPPAQVQVALSAYQITWQSEAPPPAGSHVSLALFLSPKLPEPLRLYAVVTEASHDHCIARFVDQDEEFEEWMTRTLFRYHRRELSARHQS